MPGAQRSPVGRGVVFGLVGACLLGGLGLVLWGAYGVIGAPDCGQLSPSECALEREIALAFGRRQVTFGAALAGLGVALVLYLRAQARTLEEERSG